MIYMQSTSAYDGTYMLTVSFEIGSDPNMDQVLVQNRVQNAMAQLPQAVQAQGVSIRAKSSSILLFVTLNSPDKSRDSLFMWNYATINLVNELARLPGVGNVTVMGAGEYSMRIWMDPNKLYSFGLVPYRRDPGHQAAEPGGRGGPGRHAAGADRSSSSSTPSTSSRGSTIPKSSPTSSSRTRPPRAGASSGSRMSRASILARRPIPRTSSSTASPPPGSRSTRPPTPIR